MAKLALVTVILFFGLKSSMGLSYPNMISYGYGSCMSCHYNPFGSGPLTDYGRAVAASEIANRFFWSDSMADEEIAEHSGFLGSAELPAWLRPSLSYRGLYLIRDFSSANEEHEAIHMNAGIGLVAKFLNRDKLTLVAQFAYAPRPRVLGPEEKVDLYRSREHYVGYRLSREWGVYVGLMDKVFGIRVPDHIAYSRVITGLNQNDQSHGVLLHYSSQKLEFGLQPFVGNLVQDKELRQQGLSAMAEVPVTARARLGASALSSSSDFVDMLMYAAHSRIGVENGHSVMLEIGEVNRKTKQSGQSNKSHYLFTQSHYRILRGLWGFLTIEALRPDFNAKSYQYRLGPGIQFFPVQRLELRSDLYRTTRVSAEGSETVSWDLAAQIHVWL